MKTILLIEDNADIRENMGEILELANYRVMLAVDGKSGIATALKEKPDLIVCDIMMPGLDGYGVIHLLQKHDEMANIPFIFITAKAERSEIRKGMELGADDYITKPFTGTELLNAVEGRLRKAEQNVVAPVMMQPLVAEIVALNLEETFIANQEINSYKKKQLIYSEGQQAYRIYKVQTGKVKIFKTNDDGKELIINICQAGEFFGYNALLEDTALNETAEAIELSEIASINRDAFNTLIQNPEVMTQFIRLLAGNVREKEEQLLGLAYNSLRKKVAETLIILQAKYKDNLVLPTIISLGRDNMAAIAGTAKESLIRTLGDFRDEGLIEIHGTDIVILKEEKLSHLYN